jgi:hypothetical protein
LNTRSPSSSPIAAVPDAGCRMSADPFPVTAATVIDPEAVALVTSF